MRTTHFNVSPSLTTKSSSLFSCHLGKIGLAKDGGSWRGEMDKMRRERESDWFGLSFCFPPVVMKVNFPKRRRKKIWRPRSLDSEVLDMKLLTYPGHGTQSSLVNTFLIKKKKIIFLCQILKFLVWINFKLMEKLKEYYNPESPDIDIVPHLHSYSLFKECTYS